MRSTALLLFVPLALAAQTVITDRGVAGPPVTSTPESAPEDLASIDGQVLNSQTGEPVKKALVVLRRANPTPNQGFQPGYSTTSDASGNFSMKNIEPGQYRLAVNRTGYVNAEYNASAPGRPGSTLSVGRAQKLKDLVLRLTPHGVITGRILDQDGDPAVGLQVQLLRFRYQGGRKQLAPSGGGGTNDLGEYRIYGVAPGKYYLSAVSRIGTGDTVDRSVTPPQAEEDYVTTYFPGTIDAASAAQIEVTPGSQLANVNFTLSKTHTVRVGGRIISNVTGPSPIMLSIVPRVGFPFTQFARPTLVDGATGKFEIRGVVPGSYTLSARTNKGGRSYSAAIPVDVGSGDLDNLTLTLGSGVPVTGNIRVEGDSGASLNNLQVTVQPRDNSGTGTRPGPLQDDRSFKLEDVTPGQYRVNVFPLPDGFYVKAIRSGNTDVLAAGLDVSTGSPEPLQVVLNPNAGQLAAVVQNSKTQQPAPGATVVLIPQEKDRIDQQSFYRIGTTDQLGSLTLRSLVPGEYKAYAWEDVEPGAYQDPDFMKPFESKGESVSVKEGDRLNVQLTLIPADGARPPQ